MVVTLRIGRPARRAGGHDRSTRGPGTRRIQRCASNLKGVGTRRTNEYGVFDEVTGQCVGTVGLTRCTTSATSSSQDHSPPSTAGGCPDSTIESDFPGTAQELGETCNATKRRLRQEMTYTHQLLGHRGCSRASPRPFWCDPQARCCTASTSAHDRQQLRVCTWRDAQH